MFEAIENLLTIVIWGAAILLFVGGIIVCIVKLVKGSIGSKFMAVVAAFLGVVAFVKMYDWTEHIAWCMLGSGLVICLFTGVLFEGEDKPKERGFVGQVIDQVIEDEHDIAKMEEAIRRSKK